MRFTHVIFDVDGLLVDTEAVYCEVSSSIVEKYGKTLEYSVRRTVMGCKPYEAATLIVQALKLPLTPDEWLSLVTSETTPERWQRVNAMPGAQDVINYFVKHNIPIAAATGCHMHEFVNKMKNHPDIRRHLKHVVASGDDPAIKRGKPHPDIFLNAVAKFTPPPTSNDAVLVFEDSVNGVLAAVAAGMHVVWVPPIEEPPSPAPETVPASMYHRITRISSLKEFTPELFGLPDNLVL